MNFVNYVCVYMSCYEQPMRMFLWSAVIFLRVRVSSRSGMKYVRKDVTGGQR
jgi:hypothetical protein